MSYINPSWVNFQHMPTFPMNRVPLQGSVANNSSIPNANLPFTNAFQDFLSQLKGSNRKALGGYGTAYATPKDMSQYPTVDARQLTQGLANPFAFQRQITPQYITPLQYMQMYRSL